MRKNAILMILYEVLLLIVPLILTPYLSRKIGAYGIGLYSYAHSIAFYFVILIQLGVKLYGRREIAKVNDEKQKYSKVFASIFSIEVFLFIFVSAIYVAFLFFYETDTTTHEALLVLYIELIAALLDITWLYYGLEQFKVIVVRNCVVRLAQILLILCFVSGPDDVIPYVLIMSICNLAGVVSMWFKLNRQLSFVRIRLKDMTIHLIPMLQLFIPVLSTQLFSVVDRTIIGLFLDMDSVGYYENSYKVAKVPVVVITALGSIMLPRITKLIADGKESHATRYLEKSMSLTMFLTIGISFGICSIASTFMPIFLGSGFEECIPLLEIMSFMLIFIGWGNVLRTQYMLPKGYDALYMKSVVYATIINIAISFLLISFFGVVGVALAALTGEMVICVYTTFKIKKELRIAKIITDNIVYLFSGIGMLLMVIFYKSSVVTARYSFLYFIYEILIGGIAYLLMVILFEKMSKNTVVITEIKRFFKR